MKKSNAIISILLLICLYFALAIMGIGCPIKFLTGISCGMCGMTRAYTSLVHLNFGEAFYYHPLYWIPPIFFALYLIKDKLKRNIYKSVMGGFLALFVVVYIVRLFNQADPVVDFDIKNGAFFKLIKTIIGGFLND